MGGTLTAYIVFKELDKAGTNVGRSEILFALALRIVPNQAHNNLDPVLRPSLSAPHHPIRAHHGGHHHRPPPPRLWTSVALLCFSRGAPPYLNSTEGALRLPTTYDDYPMTIRLLSDDYPMTIR